MTPLSPKIQIPELPSPILHRQSLVASLTEALDVPDPVQNSLYKLVLLCAPAGYGKTTLLVEAVSRCPGLRCWYTLSEGDADLAFFLHGLLASIRCALPTFGFGFAPQLEESVPDAGEQVNVPTDLEAFSEAFLDAFTHEISERFILVLTNYHEINQHATINQFISRLIACLSQQGVIVLESRAMPNLILAPLIARRQMFALGNRKLLFTPREVHDLALLQGITTLSFQEAEQLTNAFEGWIAGILLGSSLGYPQFHYPVLHQNETVDKSTIVDENRQLLTYITDEVFKGELSTYEFLVKTSILARLKPEHCDALLESNDAADRLIYAEQQGLFVVRDRGNAIANQSGDYLCHPVLRQLFIEHLHQQSPTYYQTLQIRAARLLQAERQYGQALEHACQAQEYDLAVSIILEAVPSMIYEEQGDIVRHWLELLPEDVFKQHPQLLLIASNIHLRQGEFSLVPSLLDAADLLLTVPSSAQNTSTLVLLQAEICIARGHLLFFQGEFQRTQEFCRQALKLLPSDERRLHIRAYQYLGIALIVGAGRVQEGITQLQHALQMSKSQQNEQQIATLHRLVANAYSWVGNHALAEHHQMRAFEIWEKLHNSQGIIYSLASLGLLKMRQGFTGQAEELLARALHQARDISSFKSGEAYALVALGELYNSLGQYAEALNYLEDGLNLARDCEDRYLICCGLCNLATAYLFMDDTQTAQFFLNQITFKEQEKYSYERFFFNLTQGAVYLAQRNYEQAESILGETAEAARQAGIQIIYITALLRVAASYLQQKKRRFALQTGKRIIDLNKKGDFGSFLQIELRRYAELQPFLDQMLHAAQGKNGSQTVDPLPQESSPLPGAIVQIGQGQQEVFSMQILALGEPKVILNGSLVTRWRMARAMELFFFLLESGRPLRKDQITLALWPEHDSDQIDTTVRTTIYYLRKALGENSMIFQSGLYRLNLAAIGGDKLWYDVDVFNEHFSQGKKALEEKDDAAANVAFTRIVDLYHGDYVQSFYNDWCIFRRDKLRQAYMDAHHQLALIASRREDWEGSLHYWQHLLTVDACHEGAHYGIMRCYLSQGKRELALRQFQRCSQNLHEEFQTTPGTSIQKLYRSIVS